MGRPRHRTSPPAPCARPAAPCRASRCSSKTRRSRLSRERRDGQTLAVESTAAPAMIRVDPEDLQQVITQVVRNARDAMPAGGAVRIDLAKVSNPETELRGDYVRLRVADTGCGMDW